ncbi:hypothetical protein [Nautilia sp.]
MHFTDSFRNALRDINHIKIHILLNGLLWSVIWLIIGVFSFKYLYMFFLNVVETVKFGFLNYDSKNFFFVFLLFQSVVVSLGAVFYFVKKIYKSRFPFLAAVVTAVLLWLCFFAVHYDYFSFEFKNVIDTFSLNGENENLAFILSLFVLYSFYISSLYIGFEYIIHGKLKIIRAKQYPCVNIENKISFFKLFIIMVIDLVIFVIFLIMIYPVLFLPFLNIIAAVFVWSFLTKEIMSEFLIQQFGRDIKRKTIWWSAVLGTVFNFIPVLNFFSPAVGILFLYHYVFEKERFAKGGE